MFEERIGVEGVGATSSTFGGGVGTRYEGDYGTAGLEKGYEG